jgi:7,8-dihydropterin-6-yl-methyl-4-(beta-D-ribofuranosyl)aminobenzene 5'-phosphate synthase
MIGVRAAVVWLVVLVLATATIGVAMAAKPAPSPKPSPLTVTILYDNRSTREDLGAAWGFSCLVSGPERTILFDTGGDGPTLLGNMDALGIRADTVDAIVLSHAHGDHVGGLESFLRRHGDVTVYGLESFRRETLDAAREKGAQVIEVGEPAEVCPGVLLTGTMRGSQEIPEQALVLASSEGPVVITGCAHPGIVEIVERVGELTRDTVHTVIGGFHLVRQSDAQVRDVIERLKESGVRRAAPCHCSGDGAIGLFRESFPDGFLPCSVGQVIRISPLPPRVEATPEEREGGS